jgi:hypothetical protein
MDFDILDHDAALFSLKRDQLRALCRERNLKANGANEELIGRLKEYQKERRQRRTTTAGGETDQESFALVESNEELKELGVEQGQAKRNIFPFSLSLFSSGMLNFIARCFLFSL